MPTYPLAAYPIGVERGLMTRAAACFECDTQGEHQIRTLADQLYPRADWRWAQHGETTLTHT